MLKTFAKLITYPVKCHPAVCCYSSKPCPSIAVVLAGSGVNDGSEVHEASAILSHITRNKAVPHIFAPDIPQMDVINHLECKQDTTHCRNVLVESARIARGQILPLSDLAKNIQPYDAVVFPGGFGAAKNLSDFATKGPELKVIPDVEAVIKAFHSSKKPIGFTCIAPILAARVICGVAITLGQNSCDQEKWPYKDAIKAAELMGAVVENKDVNETTFDRQNLVFSTPAYMYGVAEFHEVDDGIGGMIKYMMLTIKDGKC